MSASVHPGTAPCPSADAHARPFWGACREHRLVIASCEDCGQRFLPFGPCCPRCWSARLGSVNACGEGTVETCAIYRRSYDEALPAPYVVAVIALREGPRLLSNVVGCAPEAVSIGMEVRVVFESASGLVLPRFEPAALPRRAR